MSGIGKLRWLPAMLGLALVVLSILCVSDRSFAAEPSVEANVVFGTYSGLALLMDVYKPATSKARSSSRSSIRFEKVDAS